MAGDSLSVVLPAFNEETALPGVIGEVFRYLPAGWQDFEVIVVDDGSTDGTPQRLAELQGRYPLLRIVRHEQNRGYGEALRSGFGAARFSWLLLMDADGQFRIADLERLRPYAGTHDVVAGWRARRADNFWRALLTWGYVCLIRLFFGLKVKDVGCGFKLFSRRSWEQVQPIASSDHKIFTVEWLWKAQRRGLSLVNVPVRHFPRQGGRPTGARLDIVWQMVRELLRLRVVGVHAYAEKDHS
jgi:glycosyltransferase involved in cell wall biosynthesis